jgi:hypothetical protein
VKIADGVFNFIKELRGMPGKKEQEVSVKDLVTKTRKELLELAGRLGVAVGAKTRKSGIVSAIAAELSEGAEAGARLVEEGRKKARKAAAGATKRIRGAARGPGRTRPGASRLSKVVASVVRTTAEVAGKLMHIEEAAEKAAAQAAKSEEPAETAPYQAPVGGENPPVNGHAAVVHGTGQAEAMKFSIAEKPQTQTFVREEYLGELPDGYGSDRLFLIGRDPNWIFLYWDLSPSKAGEIRSRSEDGRMRLQVLDVTDIVFDGFNAHKTLEYLLPDGARNWYAYVNAPGRDFIARLGSRTQKGFETAVTSRRIRMPPDDFSARTDATFVTIPFEIPFERLMRMIREMVKDTGDVAVAMAALQARGVTLPFSYGGEAGATGFFEEFVGADGEKYRKFMLGSEEMLLRLKREAPLNVSSGGSGNFGGSGG